MQALQVAVRPGMRRVRLYSTLLLALLLVGVTAFFSTRFWMMQTQPQPTIQTRTGMTAHSSRVGGQPGRTTATTQATVAQQDARAATNEAEADRVQVAARFETSGEIIPERFVWRERPYEIVDQGRAWRAEGIRYFLVTTRDGRIWQLRYTPTTQQWTIEAKSEPRTMM